MCEGKEGKPVHVIRDTVKDDINPAILSKETLDLEDDEIEEEKSKLFKRKLKKLSRKTVAKLQRKVNLKASSNIIFVLHRWSFKGEQNRQGIEKSAWKLHDFIKRVGIMKMGQQLRERDDQKTMKVKMWKRRRRKLRKSHIDYQKLGNSVSKRLAKPKMTIKSLPCSVGPKKDGEKKARENPSPALWTAAEDKLRVNPEPGSLTQREWGILSGTEGEIVKFPPLSATHVKTRTELDTCPPKRTLLM
ncbi:hypothetical protein TNCT_155571 [Trichonephila clavata]|uniref:DUF382 domain-containing protein n=1 Tax=Trichonephila clavata TaxID=2740835 RepID=A0A8X6L8S7_TRICU|nr:hypothetical protein TNCT_155571 [Trichonephila clavata]